MAAARNRVFTIEEIYESVWNERAYESNNTVMVHIARLRNKIEENQRTEVYSNVWGVGYKLKIKSLQGIRAKFLSHSYVASC